MPASRADPSGHRQNGVIMQHPISGQTFRWRASLLLIFAVLISNPAYATLSVTESSDSITVHIGSGSNVSYLAFAESSLNPKSIIYAWHYDGLANPDGNPRTGYDLFNTVATETAGSPWALSYSTGAFGLTTSFTIGSSISRVVDPLKSPVWTYWIQGGSEYVAWGDDYDEELEAYASFTFSVGDSLIVSPAYWDTRYISNGSYDVWTINPYSYTGVASDTHYYTDTSGKVQPVTFGTYEGFAPVIKKAPIVRSSEILPASQLKIDFTVVEGGLYQLQKKDDLTSIEWQSVGSPFTATTTQTSFTLTINNPFNKGFFRLFRKE